MIKLDISQALFLYLSFSVIGVLLLWVFFGSKTKDTNIKKDKEYVEECSICAYVYVDSQDKEMSKCPQCGSYNKKKKPLAA